MKTNLIFLNWKKYFSIARTKIDIPKQELHPNSSTNKPNIKIEISNIKPTYKESISQNCSRIFTDEEISKMHHLNSDNKAIYRACVEPLISNKNNEILIFFHRISKSTIFFLSLKYLIPITTIIYLIKTNPCKQLIIKSVYITFPAMLPILSISLFIYLGLFFNHKRLLKNVINEIWLDASGKEVKIVYRNMRYRRFRDQPGEEILLVNSLVTPRGNDLITLKGTYFFKYRFTISRGIPFC